MGNVAVLIAAAGSGQRLGLGPKAFVEVGGRTLLEHCAAAFSEVEAELVVAAPNHALQRAQRLLPDATVIAGGEDRQATVRGMLRLSRADIVLVHDVARPFLTAAVLRRVIAGVERTGAASAALAPADTVVLADAGQVVERERLRLVQTPQGFDRLLLTEAHERAVEAAVTATDDAALVRRLGSEVTLVEGSPLLAKLTVAADLPLFEALHAVWRREVEAEHDAGR